MATRWCPLCNRAVEACRAQNDLGCMVGIVFALAALAVGLAFVFLEEWGRVAIVVAVVAGVVFLGTLVGALALLASRKPSCPICKTTDLR